MRHDMHKVLCEHPRHGRRIKRRSRYRGSLEDAPRREPISRHRGGTKSLAENLGPLRRWLHQIGVGVEVGFVGEPVEGAAGLGDGGHGQGALRRRVHQLHHDVHARPGRDAAAGEFG